MKIGINTSICLFCLFNWTALNAEYVFNHWSSNGGPFCKLILDESMTESRGWNGVGEPPISVAKVSEIIEKWGKDKFGQEVDLHIVIYELISFRSIEMKNNVWLWHIDLNKFKDGAPMKEFTENVIILMDGSLIEKVCD